MLPNLQKQRKISTLWAKLKKDVNGTIHTQELITHMSRLKDFLESCDVAERDLDSKYLA